MIRVLQDPPLDGPTNMARDEALMTCVGRSESPCTLRLYQWDPPTISLGYFQRYAEYESLAAPAGTLPVVRRLTGGGAILHDLELTYSLTLPSNHRLLSKGANRLYEMAHDAVIAWLASLDLTATRTPPCKGETKTHTPPFRGGAKGGVFFCFESRHRYDVLIGRDKIAGSAQRRRREAILQHGSIIVGGRYNQQVTADVPLSYDESIRQVRSGFAEHLAAVAAETLQPGDWSTMELAASDELAAKYAGDAWTKRT